MVFGLPIERQTHAAEQAMEEHVRNVAAFPLAIPLLAGPGAITATVLLAGQAGGRAVPLTVLIGVIVIVAAACLVTFPGRGADRQTARDHRQYRAVAPARCYPGRARRAICARRHPRGVRRANFPNTTACMMRPGIKVNAPAITSPPKKIASRWIGLHGPHSLISWMKNALTPTIVISTTQIQPTVRCGNGAFGSREFKKTQRERRHRRDGVKLDGRTGCQQRGQRHAEDLSSWRYRRTLYRLADHQCKKSRSGRSTGPEPDYKTASDGPPRRRRSADAGAGYDQNGISSSMSLRLPPPPAIAGCGRGRAARAEVVVAGKIRRPAPPPARRAW